MDRHIDRRVSKHYLPHFSDAGLKNKKKRLLVKRKNDQNNDKFFVYQSVTEKDVDNNGDNSSNSERSLMFYHEIFLMLGRKRFSHKPIKTVECTQPS